MNIDVVITSMNEPQLDRCLQSVRNQTYPFYRIINIHGVSPFYVAYNRAVSSVETDWFVFIGGDMILYERGLERVIRFMEKYPSDKCCGYYITLYDPFLEIKTGYLGLQRTATFKKQLATDDHNFDRNMMTRLRQEGWFIRKSMGEIAGTHFENPDEFQVFHRFFTLATRDGEWGYEVNRNIVVKLYEKHKDSLHTLALDALDFGKDRHYPKSIDINHNHTMYEEFKQWRENRP